MKTLHPTLQKDVSGVIFVLHTPLIKCIIHWVMFSLSNQTIDIKRASVTRFTCLLP